MEIVMSNSKILSLDNETPISVYKSDNEFDHNYLRQGYLARIFEGFINSTEVFTSPNQIGIAGFLADGDYFTINNNYHFYKTSSIVSIN
ncbi:hypothetical protein [Companilactobacillus nuruki]|uniref:Uncharacterized protein n=1 Tax=Companilactobacillus nuruki TaxID=1993540 RepID=A0A2N7AV00_9LACO|nr:hypothetical protein [Companilactobacillus nuruki]PMD71469.1 hypothetical protein CBP76_04990 [Companilactobacillus nuruki]